MNEWWNRILESVTVDYLLAGSRALVILAAGFIVARLVSRSVERMLQSRLTPHQTALARRASYYLVLTLFGISVLHQLGFNLSVLLGAAGIVSVAVGFASQTSASNLISGLFLIGEQPFAVGDTIQVGGTTGEVIAIDLLSVKLRTADNLYVRIPNETLIKSEVTTLTKFPIRRLDIQFSAELHQPPAKIKEILLDLASRHPLCMEEPHPVFTIQGFHNAALNLQFSVWVRREGFLEARNTLQEQILAAFAAHNIVLSQPRTSLEVGAIQTPVPLRIVRDKPGETDHS